MKSRQTAKNKQRLASTDLQLTSKRGVVGGRADEVGIQILNTQI